MNSRRKFTKRQIESRAKKLLSCRTLRDVEQLILARPNTISLHAFEPLYYHFTLPKVNGEVRYIEAPNDELKRVQRKLNSYLQCVYYTIQTAPCYGFTISAIAEKRTKNIYSNAQKHLGCSYLLNVDVDDFFHQIKTENVQEIFTSEPFQFDPHTANTIAKLCTYNGRLPMGTPTSPVISNFYTIQPDLELQKWADEHHIMYTRFVDDLTFSSVQTPIDNENTATISAILEKFNLPLNSEKQQLFGPKDVKKVTGLLVGRSVEIERDFYSELDEDLIRLQKIVEVNQITGMVQGLAFLRRFKQEVIGKINFVKQIMGKHSDEYVQYMNAFHDALEPKEQFVSRWTHFNNYT